MTRLLPIAAGKVPPPKSMSSALISSYASESATHSQDQQGQHSQDSKTDKPQNLGSANAEVVAEQPSDATALKSKHAAASKLSIAAASGGWKRPLAWEKLTADGSNSAAANARSSSQSNSAQQALNLPAHAKTSSHEQLHGSGPIHRRSRHSRWDCAEPMQRRSHMVPGHSIGSKKVQS